MGAWGGAAVSTVYVFPTDDEAADGEDEEDEEDGGGGNGDSEEDEEPTFREKFQVWLLKFIDTFCVWDCGWPWLMFQQGLAFIVFDPFVELYITLCIVVNTLFMALDHHEMDPQLDFILNKANVVSVTGVYGSDRLPSFISNHRLFVECKGFYIIAFKFVLTLNELAVFQRDVRRGSSSQANGDESKVLLPNGLEHFRLHHRHFVRSGTAVSRLSRSVGVTFFSFSKYRDRILWS